MLKFEWDEVFDDTQALMYFDDDHSIIEDRFILLGSSASDILVVIYCERHKSIIRIISARKATKKETKQYEKGI